MPDTLQF